MGEEVQDQVRIAMSVIEDNIPSRATSSGTMSSTPTLPGGRTEVFYTQLGRTHREAAEQGDDDEDNKTNEDILEFERQMQENEFQKKIEEKINIDTLDMLKTAFEEADEDGSGELDLDEFKALLRGKLQLEGTKDQQIDALFYKIDYSSDGLITWDEFCTYMQLEYAEKEDSVKRAKEVFFNIPAKFETTPHRETVVRMADTVDGTQLACSQDGMVSFWSSNLDPKRTRSVAPQDSNMRPKQKWITDFCLMPKYNKIIVGTGDREIQFFELSSFEPYCQINNFDVVPIKIDYSATGDDECMVFFGDSEGCVNILTICSAGECLRIWKKAPKVDGIANVSIDAVANGLNTKYLRWQVHGDWTQELKYYHEIRQVISCSNHANTALVIGCTIGSTDVDHQQTTAPPVVEKKKNHASYSVPKVRLDTDQAVFKVYKGVKTFAFSKRMNLMVTGGMDRILRTWNPYVPGKPTGMLRGHSAPIFYLFVAEEDQRIFSVSTDKTVKVWDIQDQTCLVTIRPKVHKIRGDLQCCHYSNIGKCLVIGTDQMSLLSIKAKSILHADIVTTHREPIHACAYNEGFKQVITCSDASIIKLWDFESGNPIFEYGDAHGDAAINCMVFDNTGRRIITGGRDGTLKIWNYNNGHCLRTLTREKGADEVCSCQYVEMNKNRYIVAVGWDRNINIYSDDPDEDDVRHILNPQPIWNDDASNGHKEDILSVAQSPPNLLATSSYDGEVIIWNMVSGHIFCHLRPPPPKGYQNLALDGDLSINTVLFLKSRAYNKDAASLVAGGPWGYIHLWNVFHGGSMRAQFPATKREGAMVTCMVLQKDDSELFTADSNGFVFLWNLNGYCLSGKEKESPELLTTWRGHIDSITCIDVVEEHKMVITAALDCTVRLWTVDGNYVGTFGQTEPWDVFNSSTFQHPMVPYDVLIDPMSLPDHPVINDKQNREDSDSASDEERESHSATPPMASYTTKEKFYVDDKTIAEQLKQQPYKKGTGKRLRHEKEKPKRVDRGGPSEYQALVTFDIKEPPNITKPKTVDAQYDNRAADNKSVVETN